MRPVFTALLACLFVVMVTADRFVCPDGCTDEAPTQATSPHTSSACALCQGWSQAPTVVPSRPVPRLIAKQLVVVTNPAEPALPAVEHPPKLA